MPYINKEDREKFYDVIECMTSNPPDNEGELNYIITMICKIYLENNTQTYKYYNQLVGVLESAKLELYRRLVARYEDEKKDINGDVY